MAMTLRDGTPSVPSSAIGKPIVSPALASILVEVVRTARGVMRRGSGACAAVGAVAPVEPNHILPRMTHGTHAAARRPAISQNVRRVNCAAGSCANLGAAERGPRGGSATRRPVRRKSDEWANRCAIGSGFSRTPVGYFPLNLITSELSLLGCPMKTRWSYFHHKVQGLTVGRIDFGAIKWKQRGTKRAGVIRGHRDWDRLCPPKPQLRTLLRDARADLGDIEIDDLVGHVLDTEPLGDDLLQGGGPIEEGLGRGEEGAELARERLDVAGGGQRHVDVADDLWDAADIGGDQGHLRRGGFEDDIGERFRARRHHHAARARERAPRRLRA